MKKLNLNDYSDKDLVNAFFELRGQKFLTVLNSIAAISERMKTRGETIAKENSEELTDKLFRDLFEGNEQ